MSFFGPSPGAWGFHSKKDPRWNCSGDVEDLVVSFGMPTEAQEKLAALKRELGEPPKDLEFWCHKD